MADPDRRQFLGGALALGCSAAASPLVTPVALASAPWDQRLVVVILRGAMDGLDLLRPTGDRGLATWRPGLEAGLDLGAGGWQLHPGMAGAMPLWDRGALGFAHAVSTPYRDRRSHFDGQDLLETGGGGSEPGDMGSGWLNRLLTAVPGAETETAYAIGQDEMLILTGDAPVGRWSPEARLHMTPATERLLEMVQHDDPLFRAASSQAIAIADGLSGQGAGGEATGLNGPHVDLASFAAGRLRQDTRIASFSINGWDTHANQERTIARPLQMLTEVLLTLEAGLGPVWDRTAVLCVTEFGRTVRLNGSGGTDHGTGGAMVLAGGALRGGRVVADWPGLGEGDLYAGRDLMPTRDLRAHVGWVLTALFGLDRALIEGTVFPGLDLGTDPGWIV